MHCGYVFFVRNSESLYLYLCQLFCLLWHLWNFCKINLLFFSPCLWELWLLQQSQDFVHFRPIFNHFTLFFQHWELLLLRTLSWDLATVTPIDFMDHIFLRIRLEDSISKVQMTEVRNRIETILVLAATEYVFSYVNPSLLAASAIHLVISRFNCNDDIDPRLCKCILALPVSKKHQKRISFYLE